MPMDKEHWLTGSNGAIGVKVTNGVGIDRDEGVSSPC